jgi:hypothetical protein
MLIRKLQPTDVKFRIRSDRSIEFAEKWHPEVDAEVNELRFEIFQEPVIRIWKECKDITAMLHLLADKIITGLTGSFMKKPISIPSAKLRLISEYNRFPQIRPI